jgi:hypothetical protein
VDPQDDQRSLAELRDYLNSDDPEPPASLVGGLTLADDPDAHPASSKSERRHSLPLRPSINSLRSEYSITSPRPEVTAFQVRRKRAAKLTNFFGESYRDLVGDILESIQKGLEEEVGKGNLNREEMQVSLLCVVCPSQSPWLTNRIRRTSCAMYKPSDIVKTVFRNHDRDDFALVIFSKFTMISLRR